MKNPFINPTKSPMRRKALSITLGRYSLFARVLPPLHHPVHNKDPQRLYAEILCFVPRSSASSRRSSALRAKRAIRYSPNSMAT